MPYRGDYRIVRRGSIFGAIGRGLKVIGGAALGGIGGFLGGGPVGAIKGAIGGAVSGAAGAVREGVASETAAAGDNPAADAKLVAMHNANVASQTATKPVGGSAAATPHQGKMIAPPAAAMTGGSRALVAAGGGGLMIRGYHLDKRTHSYAVRNRRMNPYNPRALARAERRVHSFVKHAMRMIRWVHPHKKGKAVPAIKRRKR